MTHRKGRAVVMLHSAAHEPDMEAAMHSVIEPATTIVPPIRALLRVAPLAEAEERPAYRYSGEGRFLPANAAAWREVDAWNAYATMMTDRSAAARSRHQDH